MTSDRRGPGQPRIGARTQVVIPDVILDAADREAAARGLTAGRGRSVVLRDWLEVGYRRHALAQETPACLQNSRGDDESGPARALGLRVGRGRFASRWRCQSRMRSPRMYVFPEGNRASFLSQPTTFPVAVGPMQNAWRRGRFVWMPVGQAVVTASYQRSAISA